MIRRPKPDRRSPNGGLRFEPLERREVLDAGGIDTVVADGAETANVADGGYADGDVAVIDGVLDGATDAGSGDGAYADILDQVFDDVDLFDDPPMMSLFDEDPPPEDPPPEDPPPEDPPPEDPPPEDPPPEDPPPEDPPPEDPPPEDPPPEDPPPEDPPPEDPPPEDPPPEDPPPEDPPPEDPPPEDPPPEDPPPEDPPPEDPPEVPVFEVQLGLHNVLTVSGDVLANNMQLVTMTISWQGVEYVVPLNEDGFYWQIQLDPGEDGVVYGWATDEFGIESNLCEYWVFA